MPYIVVNVMGNASKHGNGSLWIDGHPKSLIKDGQVIYVGTGTHSIKYVPTLKKSEWTTTVDFDHNSVMIANVLDDDFAKPKFDMMSVSTEKLEELSQKISEQKKNEEKSNNFSCLWDILKFVGVIVLFIILLQACGLI